MRAFTKILLASLPSLALTACATDEIDLGASASALVANAPSTQGVQPVAFPGNFVASDDDQVCYELDGLVGWDLTAEMRGFKIDNPTDGEYKTLAGTFTLTQPYLAWTAAPGVDVLAAIVKGGPSYNLYDYQPYDITADTLLHSPPHKRNVPAISHFNICYQPTPPAGDQGCTPGYWRNHADRWLGASPAELYDATFGVTSSLGATYRLGQAIWATGGGEAALARHATAGLLNSFGGVPNGDGTTVAYPFTTAQVIAVVQAAYATEDDAATVADERAAAIEAAKDQLAQANELGCPLSGTSACAVE